MPKDDVEVVESRQKQSAESKRVTFEMLKSKKRAEREVPFKINDEDVTMLLRAIGNKEYDALVSKYPPTTDQKADGMSFNPEKFGPALMSRVVVDPEMTAAQWNEIWTSPDWSRGEVVNIYIAATELCQRGFDIPFN